MSLLKVLIVAAPLALTTAAVAAAPDKLTDAQYIAAARCQALMASNALGREDTKGVDQVMRTQGATRDPAVAERADEARAKADRDARHAGPDTKAALVAERDGACHALIASTATSGSTRTN